MEVIKLKLGGKSFQNFSSVNVDLRLDTVASTFQFVGFFEITDTELKELFKPLSYISCEVWLEDEENNINEKLITGTVLNHSYNSKSKIELTSVSGYSITGIFEDINIPPKLYPLQFDNQGLDKITKKICDEFNIRLNIFDNAKVDAAKVFEMAKASPGETIKSFISKLARNRNITVAHDNLGQLLLYKVEGKVAPKIKIDENDIKVISVSLTPNAQQVHSEITVIKQSSTDTQNEGIATIKSPFVSGLYRPKVQVFKYGSIIDTTKSATAIACAEAKNFPITIELEGWTFQNKIVRSGFYIELTAPSIFISTTKFVLESVNFKSDPKKGKTMTLKAVLPCVYTGVLPSKSPFV